MEISPNYAEVQRQCLNGIDSSDVVVAILEGPDSGSGTCFECGYAFAKGKPIIGVRTDTRTSGEEYGLNAMLSKSCDVLISFKDGTGAPDEIDELAEQILLAIRGISQKYLSPFSFSIFFRLEMK